MNEAMVSARPVRALDAAAGIVVQGVFALICVVYAVIAFDYFLGFEDGREAWWPRLLGGLVSREFAFGAGSVHSEQAVAYREALSLMLMHTMMGAVCLALGPFQFIAAMRRGFPRAHRVMGRAYLVAVVLSMGAGLGYLGHTAFSEVYSGPPFAMALLGLDLMVLLTAGLAYRAIRVRAIARHQAWMAFNFGLILATPGLRLLWVLFGWLAPTLDQQQANTVITTFLLPLCLFGTWLWQTAQYPRRGRGAR